MEGWPGERIARAFPDGVREIRARTGYPDVVVAQAIVIAEGAEEGPLGPHDLGWRFWEWAETNGAGMGGLTGDVSELHGGNYPRRLARNGRTGSAREPAGVPIREASKAAWGGWRAGNGAAMRCTPIAIRWCRRRGCAGAQRRAQCSADSPPGPPLRLVVRAAELGCGCGPARRVDDGRRVARRGPERGAGFADRAAGLRLRGPRAQIRARRGSTSVRG